MYEEAGLHRFGTTLPELDEETIPSKKPIRPEDQIVTDENGKRRFHGAFTGGFSAGYWNTVGSQEGWTPATFKSSRSEKAAQRSQQRPDDFMDDEDRGEFGIAPQRLQTRAEYTSFEPEDSRKRKLMVSHSGPIPGKPVLEQFIAPRDVKIGERILKSMGWRPGQGIGPRQTRREKKTASKRNIREMYLMQQYGYQPTVPTPKSPGHSDEADGETESSDDEADKITFAPDDYDPYVCIAKKDRFGLGYNGSLSRDPVLSNALGGAASNRHINLFEPALEAVSKNNTKISFKGQAFGVGAMEEEDEDIYAKDDLSRYDFSLEDNKPKRRKVIIEQDRLIVEGFSACKTPILLKKPDNPVVPEHFIPRNWAERKSRFQPMDPKKAEEIETYFKKVELSRNRLNPDERAELLGEMQLINEKPTTSTSARQEQMQEQNQNNCEQPQNSSQDPSATRVEGGGYRLPEKARLMLERLEQDDRFTHASDTAAKSKKKSSNKTEALTEVTKQVYDGSKKLDSTMFKPFLYDEQKQRRYEEFLLAEVKTEEEISNFLNRIQPIHLSEWDREMEKKEFMQARKIFRPLDGLMSHRFISESSIEAERKPAEQPEASTSVPKKIVMKRSKSMWKPNSLLCKRYNIAEPYGGHMEEEKRPSSAKMSVFDYLEDCVHKKSDFKTPVIVPLKLPEIKPILKQTRCEPESERTANTKSVTSVSTCNTSTMTTHSLSSSDSSSTSIVVVDQLKNKHSTVTQMKDDFKKVGRPTAKTNLEKLSEESILKPPSEKLELYKAIFDDSSDEEGNEQYEATDDVALKKELLGTPNDKNSRFPPSFSADCVNILRNTSPPRGIFSALLSTKEQKPKSKETTASTSMDIIDIDNEIEHRHVRSSPEAVISKIGLIPATAKPFCECDIKLEFKQPTSCSSKTSINTASTASSKDPRTPKRPLSETHKDRVAGAGGQYGPAVVSCDIPSTSSSVESKVYGPQLPQHIRTPSNIANVDAMNKVVEEKMISFLVQRAEGCKKARDDEWVEKKVRKLLKSKKVSTSSSSSSTYESSDYDSGDRAQKKKSKKSKAHKKSKKKSKEKKSKKSKKKKGKH
ncbi:G patch domain-containing protein 1 homolog [Rhagoletis pomonella]|uniref:G patch domain-containing protein 1 homolog n=1 Tax=Rhagoletis pomonella TaxID=28610 RepID=UPI00177FA5D3|nr:G patch domain-containing protein 1 homolog [Rhagoletis pomonella]